MTTTKGLAATGHFILVQLMEPKEKTKGGIILADISKDAEQMNIACGKVIHMGPAAYRDKVSGEFWGNGPWCAVGEWVICPKFGTKRIIVDGIKYSLLNDDEILGRIDDPARLSAYV